MSAPITTPVAAPSGFDPARLSDEELVAFMAFHRRKKTQGSPAALAAVEEHVRRTDKGFELRKTVEIIRAAALKREYITYGDLAKQSGLVWDKVRYRVPAHLAVLCDWGFRTQRTSPIRPGPLLSAIVVAKEHAVDGLLAGTALDGFIKCAKALGFDADGREEKRERFVAEQQQRVFAWARGDAI